MIEVELWLRWHHAGMFEANTPVFFHDQLQFYTRRETQLFCPEYIIEGGRLMRNLFKIEPL